MVHNCDIAISTDRSSGLKRVRSGKAPNKVPSLPFENANFAPVKLTGEIPATTLVAGGFRKVGTPPFHPYKRGRDSVVPLKATTGMHRRQPSLPTSFLFLKLLCLRGFHDKTVVVAVLTVYFKREILN